MTSHTPSHTLVVDVGGTHVKLLVTGKIIDMFMAAFVADYVVLGGGNAKDMKVVPRNVRIGENSNAFRGGFRLWDDHR